MWLPVVRLPLMWLPEGSVMPAILPSPGRVPPAHYLVEAAAPVRASSTQVRPGRSLIGAPVASV